LYKLAIGYENDLSEQFYSAFSPRSALFWSHVFFAKQSVRSNQQLEAIQRTSNSLLGEKARGFFIFPFSFFRANFDCVILNKKIVASLKDPIKEVAKSLERIKDDVHELARTLEYLADKVEDLEKEKKE
jgi:hypothetical protein